MISLGKDYYINGKVRCFFDSFMDEFGSKKNEMVENGEKREESLSELSPLFQRSAKIGRLTKDQPQIIKAIFRGTSLENSTYNPEQYDSDPEYIQYKVKESKKGKRKEEISYTYFLKEQLKQLDTSEQMEVQYKMAQNIRNIQGASKLGISLDQCISFNTNSKGFYENNLTGVVFDKDIFGENISIESLSNDIANLGINGTIVSDLFKSNKQEVGVVVLDTLTFLKKEDGDIFGGNIILSERGKKCLEKIDPEINPQAVTFDDLSKIFDRDGIIRPAIENLLSERFINGVDKKFSSSIKLSDINIDQIIGDPILLKKFLDYYNYKNSEDGKALNIDIRHLSKKDKDALKKAIKKELYINAFDVDLNDADKDKIDAEFDEEVRHAKKRRQMWEMGRYEDRKIHKDKLETSDYDNAPGWQIAVDLEIGDQLLDKFGTDIKEIDIKDPRVSRRARINFRKEVDKQLNGIKLPRSPLFFETFYKETGGFINFEGKRWEMIKRYYKNDEAKLNKLTSLLRGFDSYKTKAQEELSKEYRIRNKRNDVRNNNSAIGSVLDGIRDIYSNLGEDLKIDGKKPELQLDGKTPLELVDGNNCLIINGKFGKNENGEFEGEPVKIKYDLNTGCVYMNACIADTGSMIVFGGNEPNHKVGEIKDFSSMLEFYSGTPRAPKGKKPPKPRDMEAIREEKREKKLVKLDEILADQIGKIGKKIGNEVKTHQTKNGVSTDFLKTLGIIGDQPNGTVQFAKGSDAYNVMQLIGNSENNEDINALADGMKTLVIYAKMNRGNKKPNDCEESRQLADLAARGKLNEDLGYFWGKIQDTKVQQETTGSVSENYKNGFASLICEKFTNGVESPNWQLSKSNIMEFVDKITAEISVS